MELIITKHRIDFDENVNVKDLYSLFNKKAELAVEATKTLKEYLIWYEKQFNKGLPVEKEIRFEVKSRINEKTGLHDAKSPKSFFDKLYKKCFEINKEVINQEQLNECFASIVDIAGVRIVCFYHIDIIQIVNNLRYGINDLRFIIDIQAKTINGKKYFEDKDYRDPKKDEKKDGYRSYHMFIDVVTDESQFNPSQIEYFPVEVQIRTKLQDVFNDMSHKFTYKNKDIDINALSNIKGKMEFISNSLKLIDDEFYDINESLKQFKNNAHSE
jgi:ppGpp synthetase/RelA/SpoT-type nucleotidyltranferase